MATVGRSYDAAALFNPYETSYKMHYPQRPMTPTRGDRPPNATNAVLPQPGLGRFGITHYTEEFRSKNNGYRSLPIRAGTASGARNNNPHPKKEFLVWRYPRNEGQKENMDLDEQMMITGEEFDRVVRGKCRSVYQSDFTGLQQGADVSGNFADLPEDPMSRLRYHKESTNRIIHGPPAPLPQELKVPTTRFGSKKDRLPAYGSLPGVVSNTQMHLVSRTTYDRDLNDRAAALYGMQKSSMHSRVYPNGLSFTSKQDGGCATYYGSDSPEDSGQRCQSSPSLSIGRQSGTANPNAELGVQMGRPHVTWHHDVTSARPRERSRPPRTK